MIEFNAIVRRKVFCVFLALLFVGCSDATDETPLDDVEFESVALIDDGFDVPVSQRDRERPLPAWQTAEERQAAKEDSFDVRGTYQDIYGFTAAPVGATRAVAEFERTDGVLIAWDDYLSGYMVDLVRAIVDEATVYIITESLSHSSRVRNTLQRAGVATNNVRFFEFVNDAFWTRDYGPISVAKEDGTVAMVGAEYYPDRRRDDAVPTLIARYFDMEIYRPPLATEGGNFMANGEGLCAITDMVVQANPHLTVPQILEIKETYFGCQRTVIVERMNGEETGHIDMFAKFLSTDTVMVGSYDERDDRWNAAILDRNAQRFAQIEVANGQALQVVRIPMPRGDYPVYRSYTNSTIVNGTVIVPIYRADRRYESQALQVYRNAMPGYRIVAIDSEDTIQLGGAVHCTTMGFSLGSIAPAGDGTNLPVIPEPDPVTPGELTWESSPDVAIRDLQQSLDSIFVPESGTINGILLEVDIEHSYVGDLVVWLQRGNEYVIVHQNGGGNAQRLQRTWTIDAWNGTDMAGEWLLVVEDRAQYDEGVLRRWSLSFN